MPEVRALRSFKGRYGSIRAGQTFNCEPGYLVQLLRNKLVIATGNPGEPGPSKDRSIPEAPHRGGKDKGGKDTDPSNPSGQGAGSGNALTSASLPAGQASRRKTVMQSGAGKKAKPAKSKARAKTKTSSTPAPAPDAE